MRRRAPGALFRRLQRRRGKNRFRTGWFGSSLPCRHVRRRCDCSVFRAEIAGAVGEGRLRARAPSGTKRPRRDVSRGVPPWTARNRPASLFSVSLNTALTILIIFIPTLRPRHAVSRCALNTETMGFSGPCSNATASMLVAGASWESRGARVISHLASRPASACIPLAQRFGPVSVPQSLDVVGRTDCMVVHVRLLRGENRGRLFPIGPRSPTECTTGFCSRPTAR